ncbi:MAG: glycosyltransferase family 4 protein [Desulfobacterales bacterium]
MPSIGCQDRLRVALLSYRSNPYCGGQGVYLKNLARGLVSLGHRVEVFSGPPRPLLPPEIPVTPLNGLDLYDPADPFRLPRLNELITPLNLYEWLNVSSMGFPEPFLFGYRAYRHLSRHLCDFDVIHDNQSLSYGVHSLSRRLPTVATIHHPITVDRAIAVRSACHGSEKFKQWRWYSFLTMQKQVAKRLERIITVSNASMADIIKDFKISQSRLRIVPNGIDTELFRPLPAVAKDPNRIIVTNSADTPLKGLAILIQALSAVAVTHDVRLVVVGRPKENGSIERLIRDLGIGGRVRFTGRISDEELVRQYARASIAIVPSIYEGFGLPAGEAMACGVPVISTTGGALPEVAGDAAILVPPGDVNPLVRAIVDLLSQPENAQAMGNAGYRRVQERFTWKRTAERTVSVYKEAIDGHRRP